MEQFYNDSDQSGRNMSDFPTDSKKRNGPNTRYRFL